MAKNKKTRKKTHSIVRRIDRSNTHILQNSMIMYVLNDKPFAKLVNKHNGKIIDVTPSLNKAIKNKEYEWEVMLAVFCVDQNDTQYIKIHIGEVSERCKQSVLDTAASKAHADLLHGCNDAHTIGIGWIAAPYSCDFSERKDSFYERLFDEQGAWLNADRLFDLKESM